MEQLSGGEAVVRSLEACGIETLFGIPGVHNLAIYDALIGNSRLTHYLVRHEQSAVFMAGAYFRACGKVAAALLITGPGATNAVTATMEAYGDSLPVLLIISQNPSEWIDKGKGAIHELTDQLGVFRNMTAWTQRITSVKEIPNVINCAMETFLTQRPRPVAIEIPTDILEGKGEVFIGAPRFSACKGGDPKAVELAAEMLQQSNRSVIFAGAGVFTSGACYELRELAEILQAPVFTSIKGRGALPDDHPLSMGALGADEPAKSFIGNSDLVLAVGTRFSLRSTDNWSIPFPEALIHVDIDPAVIGKNYPARLGIVGDARQVLQELVRKLKVDKYLAAGSPISELEEIRRSIYNEWRKVGEVEMALIDSIRAALPRDGFLILDSTMISYWARRLFPALEPATVFFPMGSGTLGYALSAALGVKIACPERKVLAIMGDGGFMFTCQDLATAAQYRLPITILLFNDNCYGMVKWLQERRSGYHGDMDLVNPDFIALARSFGLRGVKVANPSELEAEIGQALEADVTTIIEIPLALKPPLRSIPRV
jgi:thiamine pyrophosphate-dependent acetolactate synthase large subunit-like protein